MVELMSSENAVACMRRAWLEFSGDDRTKAIVLEPDAFMANIDPAFMKQVFHVSKRKWKSDIYHHASRMISGEVLKYRKGLIWVMQRG